MSTITLGAGLVRPHEAHEVDSVDFVKQWWPFGVVLAPGLFAVWKQRAGNRKDQGDLHAKLIEIAEEVSSKAIARLSAETDILRARIADLEAQLVTVEKKHFDSVLAKDAEIALLRGEIRHWKHIASSYEDTLTKNDIPHVKPTQAIWMVGIGDDDIFPASEPNP